MDETVNHVQHDALEVTPLLLSPATSKDHEATTKTAPRTRCTWPWLHVVSLCGAIIVTANIMQNLSKAPTIRLFESVICFEHWLRMDPSVIRGDASIPENLCKVNPVQDKLAMILGWQQFFDSIPAILLPIPYGYLADRYGRKWVLVAGAIGIAAAYAYILFVVGVLRLPLQYTWLSSSISVVGGGSAVTTATLLTIVADVVPADKRSTTFFYMLTCSIIPDCVIPPLTAILMARSAWIPLLAGFSMLVLCTTIAVMLPETLPVQDVVIDIGVHNSDTSFETHKRRTTWKEHFTKFSESFAFATRNITVFALIIGFLVSEVGRQSFDLLLQYVSKRYGWSLSNAGLLLSVRATVSIMLFALVLPLFQQLAFFKSNADLKDLWIARGSIILLSLGTLTIALSPTAPLMIIGVITYTLGAGFSVVLRSLVTTIVERQSQSKTSDVGRLYALISLATGTGSLIAGPGMSWAFRLGIRLGQAWLGLPYAIATVLFLLVSPVLFMIKI